MRLARAPWAWLALVLLAASAALAIGPVSGSAAASARRTCAQLKGKHLKGGQATVVTQLINKEQTEDKLERFAYVCTSPNGRAWPAGSTWGSEAPRITVVTGAGYWVALHYESTFGIGFSESESAINAANGKSFKYWSGPVGPGADEGASPSVVIERVTLNAQGHLALITGTKGPIEKETGNPGSIITRNVIGVEPNGKRKTLDSAPTASIPTSSLKVVGSTVYWTDDGVQRSATL